MKIHISRFHGGFFWFGMIMMMMPGIALLLSSSCLHPAQCCRAHLGLFMLAMSHLQQCLLHCPPNAQNLCCKKAAVQCCIETLDTDHHMILQTALLPLCRQLWWTDFVLRCKHIPWQCDTHCMHNDQNVSSMANACTCCVVLQGGGQPQTHTVPLEKVIDDIVNMGFSRHEVRGVVTKLMESGQSIDLNIVLDRLMNGMR